MLRPFAHTRGHVTPEPDLGLRTMSTMHCPLVGLLTIMVGECRIAIKHYVDETPECVVRILYMYC